MVSFPLNNPTHWQPEIWKVVAATSEITLIRPKNASTFSALACLPSPYVFILTNNSNDAQIFADYTGVPTIVTCKLCMLPSCVSPQFQVCLFVVLQQPPYIMVAVNVTLPWSDNYGLSVLQQLQDLMRAKGFGDELILAISALISRDCLHYSGSSSYDPTRAYRSIL